MKLRMSGEDVRCSYIVVVRLVFTGKSVDTAVKRDKKGVTYGSGKPLMT